MLLLERTTMTMILQPCCLHPNSLRHKVGSLEPWIYWWRRNTENVACVSRTRSSNFVEQHSQRADVSLSSIDPVDMVGAPHQAYLTYRAHTSEVGSRGCEQAPERFAKGSKSCRRENQIARHHARQVLARPRSMWSKGHPTPKLPSRCSP